MRILLFAYRDTYKFSLTNRAIEYMKIPFLPLKEYGSQEKHVFKYEGRNIRFDEIQATVLDVKKLLNSSTNSSHRD